MVAGLTAAGFTPKTETELIDELVTEGRAAIAPELDDSPDTVFGLLSAIFGAKLAEVWEQLELLYGASGPNASGAPLRQIGAITGAEPLGEEYSYVTAQVTCTGMFAEGTIIATVSGNSSARFVSEEEVTGVGAPVDVLMRSDTAGAVAAPAGTLTVLENPPTNVTAITNAEAATLGSLEESDAAFRLRREQELEEAGATTLDALRVAVRNSPTVTESKVYTNRDDVADSAGRPPHSVEVVVVGGNADALAQAIWDNLPAGIEPYSGTADSGTAIDAEDEEQTVAYSEASNRRLYARITGTKSTSTYAGDDEVEKIVEGFTSGSVTIESSSGNVLEGKPEIGGKVYRSPISAAVQTVRGVLSVTTVELSSVGTSGPWTSVDYQLGVREYLGTAADTRGIRQADIVVVMT